MKSPTMLRRNSWGRQIIGVTVAGGAGWVVDASLLWILVTLAGVPTSIAAAAGFLASGIVNFLINRSVFRADSGTGRVQAARYLALFLINLLIVSAAVPLLAYLLEGVLEGPSGTNVIVAKVLTTAALLIPNTFIYRHWVFAPGRPS